MILSNQSIYEGVLEAGLRLAETPESEGGWMEYFSESDECDLRIEDEMLRAQTALMLENTKRWMAHLCRKRLDESGRLVLDEATRSALVGGFSDYLFPVIRAGFPTNPINDLVSVQPTTRRTAQVIYWHWTVGRGKGSFEAGQRLFDANRGKMDSGFNFSNDVIDIEQTATGDGATNPVTGTLAQHDGGRDLLDAVEGIVGAPHVVVGQGEHQGGVAGRIEARRGVQSRGGAIQPQGFRLGLELEGCRRRGDDLKVHPSGVCDLP